MVVFVFSFSFCLLLRFAIRGNLIEKINKKFEPMTDDEDDDELFLWYG